MLARLCRAGAGAGARRHQHTHASVSAAKSPDPLVDRYTRRHDYLRISLTEKCNLRCQYCMPAEGVPLSARDKLLTSDEIVRLGEVFGELGVTKIRLTGGEPTVRRDLVSIVERLKGIEGIKTVAMTTNGLTLTRQLVALQRAGLDVINISLDTLQPPKYQQMSRRTGFERVIAGIDLAIQLNYRPVKLNCVVMKNFNLDEMCDFVEFTKDREVDVRFIEFMPFTGNKWNNDNLVSYKLMLETIRARWPDFSPMDNHPNDTSKGESYRIYDKTEFFAVEVGARGLAAKSLYSFSRTQIDIELIHGKNGEVLTEGVLQAWKVPGHAGQVGFITSMTEHFCSSCNRIRITADGNLKVCLFGNSEVSLRDALRSGADTHEIAELVRDALSRKKKQHAGSKTHKPTMFQTPYTKLGILPFSPSAANPHVRFYSSSSELSHLDPEGRARMVDVGHKEATQRKAIAVATVRVGSHICKLISDGRVKKGDVLSVAQLAGIMAAKKTPDLIPLCHNINLDSVNVTLILGDSDVQIRCEARCAGRTGVEMEALTGVTVAALTVYDMCKSASKTIRITNIHLELKTGGKSDYKLKYNTEPINPEETFAPTNFMYL